MKKYLVFFLMIFGGIFFEVIVANNFDIDNEIDMIHGRLERLKVLRPSPYENISQAREVRRVAFEAELKMLHGLKDYGKIENLTDKLKVADELAKRLKMCGRLSPSIRRYVRNILFDLVSEVAA